MTEIEKVKTIIEGIIQLCSDGPEVLTDYEIRTAIEKEAGKALEEMSKMEDDLK